MVHKKSLSALALAAALFAVTSSEAPAQAPGFTSVYKRAGSPRVVVFWNRELSEETATEYEDVMRGRSDTRIGSNGSEVYRTDDVTLSAGIRRRENAQRYSDLTERADWKLESSFVSGLVSAGAVLVDRKTIVRKAGRGAAGQTPNQQSIEMDALLGHADILIEVLQTTDESAPLDTSFRVSMKRIATGRILGQFVTAARPMIGRGRFVAGPNGYERAASPPPSVDAVARQLVQETLSAMQAGLAR